MTDTSVKTEILNFYKKYPLFDFNYYIRLNKVKKESSRIDYLHSYDKIVDKTNIITNLKDFYNIYPDFDIDFYKNTYDDLSELYDIELLEHWIYIGKNEKRYISNNSYFNNNYSIDKLFIKIFYPEMSNYNDEQLSHNIINKKLIYNKEIFMEKYPDFDIINYKKINIELNSYHDIDLMAHWHNSGNKNNKFYSIKDLLEYYKDFDIDIYKKFNNSNNIYTCDDDIIIEWYNYGRFKEESIWSLETFKNKYKGFNFNEFKFIYPEFTNMKNKDIIEFYIKKFDEYKNVNFLNYFDNNNLDLYVFDEFIRFQPSLTDKNYKVLLKKLVKDNKINTLILSIDDFKNKYPYFDLECYKKFNKTIIFNNDDEYIYNWYNKDKNNKQILCSEKMFYELYPEFKIKIYNFFNENKDIFYFYHYKYKYNLIYSVETFKANYPDFNYNFYKTYSNLNDLNEEDVIFHYLTSNMNNNLQSTIKNIEKNINIKIYRHLNIDLKHMSDRDLLNNFLNNYNKEHRIYSIKSFYNKYPEYEFNENNKYYMYEKDIYDRFNEEEDKIIYLMTEGISKYNLNKNNLVGRQYVNSVYDVLLDMEENKNIPKKLMQGISLIIRAKNEELNVKFCIESVVDLVEEIIFVDNGSTDNTYACVEQYAKKYKNIKLYKYDISVSRAGIAHKEALEKGNPNTLGLFYNWCLSKSTMNNVFKWDADFLCIRNNFIDLVNKYNVKTREDKFAIWFTGLTLFENKNNYYVNYNSYYDEFRIYSYKNGFKWSNGEICEYVEPYINSIDRKYKYIYKYPLFYEMKRTSIDEFESRSSMIDRRDINDFNILCGLKEDKLSNIIPINEKIIFNNKKILLVCSSLSIGGANSFILNMYNVMKKLGYYVKILPLNIVSIGSDKYGDIIENDILKNNPNIDKQMEDDFDIILFNATINIDSKKLMKLNQTKTIIFVTHSDVGYSNYFIMNYNSYFDKIITVNNYTIDKLSTMLKINKNNFTKLINYFEFNDTNLNDKIKDSIKDKTNNKFCIVSRFSEDKNIPMLLYSLKDVFNIYPNYKCILVGCGDTTEYDNYLKYLCKKLKIEKNVVFEGYQKDVKKYYETCDFSVLLSVSEGTPYAILESFLYKCPVLASNVGGNNELIENDKSGMLIEYDGIRMLEGEKIYITNYNTHLTTIGYIQNDNIDANYEKKIAFNNDVYIPEQLYPKCNFCNCSTCNYYTRQKMKWNKNVDKISSSINKMIENNFTGVNNDYANNAYNFFIKEFSQNNYVKTILELIE